MTFFQLSLEKLSWRLSFAFLFIICEIGVTCGPTNSAAQTCEPSKQKTITLSVTTKQGASVDNLRPEDLTVSENKKPFEILKLEQRKDQPVSVAMLIDISRSQERTLPATRVAAQVFLKSILRSAKDRSMIVSFGGDATIEQDLTNDLTRLLAAIDRVKFVPPPGYVAGGVVIGPVPKLPAKFPGSTALWDAIWTTVDGFHDDGSRRLIVIFTDGEDTNSRREMRDAIAHAADSDVAVFSIGINDEEYQTLNRDTLQKLSVETGGRAFFPKKVAELEGIFLQTTRDLESQYALTYCAASPKPNGKPVKIRIDLKNPALLQSNLQLSYPRHSL